MKCKELGKDVLERFKAKRAMIIYASILMGRPISCSNGIITVEFDEDYSLVQID